MHQLSIRIAEACVKRQWIKAIDMDWCIYAVETKLLFCAFLTLAGMITWLLGVLERIKLVGDGVQLVLQYLHHFWVYLVGICLLCLLTVEKSHHV